VAESEEWRRYLESWTEASITTLVEGGEASRWDGNMLLRDPRRIVVTPPQI